MKKSIKIAWILAVLLGCVLRLSFPGDIEFKADEAYNWNVFKSVQAGGSWPLVGMASSAGVVNPGFSVWIFLILGKLFHTQTPADLARAVSLMNCAALVLLAFAIYRIKDRLEKEIWSWAVVLASFNPLWIVLQRKIWPQSVLPLFVVLFGIAWWNRRKPFAAFVWGLFTVLLGQFHMAGFFVGAALLASTFLFQRKSLSQMKYSLLGALIAVVPLWPWIQANLYSSSHGGPSFKFIRLLMFKFWNFWLTGSTGLMMDYSLGSHFIDFLKSPVVALAHVVLVICALAMVYKIFEYWKKNYTFKKFIGLQSGETDFLLGTAILGLGLLMTLALVPLQHHYFLAVFPLQAVWQARVFLRDSVRLAQGRRWLLVYSSAMAVVSIAFLFYIHAHGGAPGADYGVAYSRQ